jgi:hypothetical protein
MQDGGRDRVLVVGGQSKAIDRELKADAKKEGKVEK